MVPHNDQPLPPFYWLVNLFEKLTTLSGAGVKDRRHEIINGFISKWKSNVGPDIYPAFQLILPQLDSENTRRLYNLKEKQFGKLLVATLQLNPNSADARRLLEYRVAKGKTAGNFAQIAFEIIEKRDTNIEYSKMSISDILEMLKTLSEAKFPQKIGIIQGLLQEMNAIELKWLVRIILTSMNLHVSEHTFFHCFHPDATALFNVTNDLKIVCDTLFDRDIRLEAKDQEIKPLCCFKPQRSKFHKKAMENFEHVVEKMPTEFYVEEKMDGERMQIHWTDYGNKVRYFSRKGKEYTELYGADKSTGSLSKFLGQYINPKVRVCILDGEMLAYDSKNQEVCPLNKVKQAAAGDGQSGIWRPMFMAFDILNLNDKDLSNVSLAQRKRALDQIIRPDQVLTAKGRFEIIPYVTASTPGEIKREFEHAISLLSEGLIVKNPHSKYTVDGFNDAWLKIKPEFISGYEGENFDLLVIGAYYGSGQRGNLLASYLCAVRNDASSEFYSVCKVGNGFCMAMYQLIQHKTEGKWADYSQHGSFSSVHIGTEAPDVVIDPKDSLVFEVKATQVWPAVKFSSGMSLRFPRFVSLREDKSYTDTLTLLQLMDFNEGKASGDVGKKRKAAESAKKPTKRFHFQDPGSNDDYKPENNIFDGRTFYIAGDIRDPEYMLSGELEALVKSQNGKITRDLNEENAIIISDRAHPRVSFLMGKRDIVHPRWIFDCVENNRMVKYEPDHYFSATELSMIAANELVDEIGFSLVRDYRLDDVERKLASVAPVGCADEEANSTLQYLMENSGDRFDTRGLLFHGATILFDPAMDPEIKTDLQRLVRFGSGQVAIIDGPAVTHVICDDSSRRAIYARHKGPFIVPSKWIVNSWENESRLDELSI